MLVITFTFQSVGRRVEKREKSAPLAESVPSEKLPGKHVPDLYSMYSIPSISHMAIARETGEYRLLAGHVLPLTYN